MQRFMQATSMQFAYAQQCLQENNFDIDAAMTVFLQLQAKGMIPAEAFMM